MSGRGLKPALLRSATDVRSRALARATRPALPRLRRMSRRGLKPALLRLRRMSRRGLKPALQGPRYPGPRRMSRRGL